MIEPSFEVVFEPLGEDAVLLRLGQGIDAETNRRVHALAAAIRARRPSWLAEIVPAYACLALQLRDAGDDGALPLQRVRAWWSTQDFHDASDARADAAVLEVPVCYGGEFGPDLADVAAHAGLAAEDVIERHLTGDYRVAMLGFAPGFPYLLGLDPRLATPRLDTPRTRVPAGSVGIGGAQAGIYPREGPGGWRLLGRTPLALFDPVRAPPSLLEPGHRVRFVRIDAGAFARQAGRRGRMPRP